MPIAIRWRGGRFSRRALRYPSIRARAAASASIGTLSSAASPALNASDQRQVTALDRATAQYLVQCLVRLAFLYSHREALHEKLVSGNAP